MSEAKIVAFGQISLKARVADVLQTFIAIADFRISRDFFWLFAGNAKHIALTFRAIRFPVKLERVLIRREGGLHEQHPG